MTEGFKHTVRTELKKILMETATREVDAVVEKAVASLQVQFEQYYKSYSMTHVCEVILRKVPITP
jgi:hypothetical protein